MPKSRKEKLGAFTLIDFLVIVAIILVITVVLPAAMSRAQRRAMRMSCVNNLKQVSLAFSIWAGDNHGFYPMARFGQPGGPKNGAAPGQVLSVPVSPAVTPWAYTYEVYQVMSNELGSPKIVTCPADERSSKTNFDGTNVWGEGRGDFLDNTGISYFYGKDASLGNSNLFLAGDRAIGVSTETSKGYGVSPAATSAAGAVTALGTNFPRGAAYPAWTGKMHDKGNVAFTDQSVAQVTSGQLRDAAEHTGDQSEPSGQGNALVFP